MALNGLYCAVLVLLLASVTYSHEYLDEDEEDGRLLVISTTGDNAFPSFPTISIGALTDANVTLGLGAALLAGLTIAGLTAATITLAILLGIEVKKDKNTTTMTTGSPAAPHPTPAARPPTT
ncbi:uncharacterized protein LOC123505834 isoform X2 [Portunus trituberculatus]|uniref:uncharacterized protein LOC123505834 isoform X2 n=1 Tax=Portunus trituberculatus TaxID=210409 RepID=UPI001E1D0EF7|nr:uncharacterized protein LOC123505834 isoform X2 [Portunus trituberculatus]